MTIFSVIYFFYNRISTNRVDKEEKKTYFIIVLFANLNVSVLCNKQLKG